MELWSLFLFKDINVFQKQGALKIIIALVCYNLFLIWIFIYGSNLRVNNRCIHLYYGLALTLVLNNNKKTCQKL